MKKFIFAALIVASAASLAGCNTPQDRAVGGALIGGAAGGILGAATGAIIGGSTAPQRQRCARTGYDYYGNPVSDSTLVDNLVASPNFGERGQGVDMLVLHYTGMETGDLALARLCDPEEEVSCHYLIWEDGRITQLVAERARAWHAGKSHWAGRTNINSASIGIELVHVGHLNDLSKSDAPVFPKAQIAACIDLCQDIIARHGIPAAHVLAHSDIAPGRKIDPGEAFPWQQLADAGIGLWTPPEPITSGRFFAQGDEGPPIEAIQALLALYGYNITVNGVFDAATQTIVAAFQRHFRPERVDGVADASTITTLRNLLMLKG
eukprot:gene13429-13543_t